jgi:hypothetical protein
MSTTLAQPTSRPWRRFLRFSVRGMIVLVLLMGAWLGWIVRGARIQREAVAAITRVGGSVQYDWEWRNGNAIPQGKTWAPQWLVNRIGVDYFGHVTDGRFPHGTIDADIAPVELLTQLQRLKLEQLHRLKLDQSWVSDDGLLHLKGLTNLTELDLRGSVLVHGTELEHLKGLTKLTILDLGESNVSDDALAYLKGMNKLEYLGLDGIPSAGADLAWMKGRIDLSELELSRTRVTDAGLVHLKGLTNLKVLSVKNTRVTDDGIRDLKEALPRLTIRR